MLECYFIDLLLNFFTNTPSVQFFLSSIAVIFNCSTLKYLPKTLFRERATSQDFVFSCNLVTNKLKPEPELLFLWSRDCSLAAVNVYF